MPQTSNDFLQEAQRIMSGGLAQPTARDAGIAPDVADMAAQMEEILGGKPVQPDAQTGSFNFLKKVVDTDQHQVQPDVPEVEDSVGVALQNHALETEDLPMPKTWQEAVRAGVSRNIAIRHYEGLSEEVEKQSRALALQFAASMGGLENMTPKDFMDVVNAYRYNATIMRSPISPDESPRVTAQYVRDVTQFASQQISDRMTQLRNDGVAPDDIRMQKLGAVGQKLIAWSSQSEDLNIQEAFLISARKALGGEKKRQPANREDLQNASRLIDWMWFPEQVPHEQLDGMVENRMATGRGPVGQISPSFAASRQVADALNVAFRSPSDTRPGQSQLAGLWEGAVRQARMEMLGLPPEQAAQSTTAASIMRTHPALVTRLIGQRLERDARRALGNGSPTKFGLERWVDKQAETFYPAFLGSLMRGRSAESIIANEKGFKAQAVGNNARALTEGAMRVWIDALQGATSAVDAAQQGVREISVNFQGLDRPAFADQFSRAAGYGQPETRPRDFGDVIRDGDMEQLRQQIAAGEVDPVLAQRIIAGNERAGVLDTGALMLAVETGLDKAIGELGPLAREAPEVITAQLFNDALRGAWDEAREQAMAKSVLITPEEFEEINRQTAQTQRKGFFTGEHAMNMMRSTTAMMGLVARDTLELAMNNPKQLAAEGVLGYGLGASIKGAAGAARRSVVGQAVSDAIQNLRTKDAMTDLIYWSPDTADKIRTAMDEIVGDATNPERTREAVRKARAAAEAVVEDHKLDWHNLDDGVRAEKVGALTKDVAEFRRTLGKLNRETLDKIFDELDLHHVIDDSVRGPGARGAIGSLIRAGKEKIGLNRRELYGPIADEAGNIAKRMERLVDSGIDPSMLQTALDDIPLSLHGVRGDSIVGEWIKGTRVGRLLSDKIGNWDGRFGSLGKVQAAAASLMGDLTEFASKWLPIARQWRAVQGAVREQQLRALGYLRRRSQIDLEELELARVTAASPDEIAQAQGAITEARARIDRFRNLAKELDDRHWDESVKLSTIDEVLDELDLDDILVLGQQMESSAGGQARLMSRLANRGQSVEEFTDQWALAAAEADEAFTARMRKTFAREYLDSPGLLDGDVFVDNGAPMLPRHAARLRAERQAAWENASLEQRAVLEHTPANDYGMDVVPLPERMADLRSWAARVETARQGGLASRVYELTDGNIHKMTRAARDSEMGVRLGLSAYHLRLKKLERRYAALPRARQREFDRAIRKANEGDASSMRNFLATDAEMRAAAGLGSIDENLERLLLDSDDFRLQLLDDMHRAGLVDEAELARMREPYFPHLFRTYETEQLLRKHAEKVLPEKPGVSSVEGVAGQDLSELMSQRHLTRHRVMVDRGKAGRVHQDFDTQQDALDWVRERFGAEAFSQDGESLFGRGLLGEDVRVLAPIGKLQEFLDLLPEGPSLFQRFQTMARDVSLAKYLSIFDRPGWVMTPEEFTRWKLLSKQNERMGRSFIEVPEGAGLGPLSGKVVPKRLFSEMRHFFESFDTMSDLAATMRESTFGGTLLGTTLGKAVALGGRAVDFTKQLLGSNAIARNPVTMTSNVLMDREIFARMAYGSDYLYSEAGREARRWAWRALFGTDGAHGVAKAHFERIGRRGGELPDVLTPDEKAMMDLAIERGVLDESLIGASGVDADHHRFMIEALYGKGADLPKGLTDENLLDRIFDTGRRPEQEARLAAEIQKLDGQLANPDAVLAAGGDELLENLSRRRATLDQALRDTGRRAGMDRVRGGLETLMYKLIGADTGLGGTVRSTSREIYARISNIHRLAGFRYLIGKGYTPEAAIEHINKFMQNYQNVPKPIRALSRSPVGSAITSFPYEMGRITKSWIKEKPFQYAAMLAAVPSINMATMAAGGLDPLMVAQVLESQGGGLPAWMAMSTTLVLPIGGSGEFALVSLPGVNPHALFREPFGILGDIVDQGDFDESFTGQAARLGYNAGSKFLFASPLVNMATTIATGRDPIRRRAFATKSEAWGNAARQFGHLLTPNPTPFMGSSATQVTEYMTQPPNVRTGRTVTTGEALLQAFGGIRVRGGLMEHVAAEANLEKPLDTLMQGVARSVTLADSRLIKYRPEPQAFSETDFINVLLWDSRRADPGDKSALDSPIDKAYNQLRLGHTLLEEGRKKGNSGQVKFANDLVRDAVKQMADDRKAVRSLFGAVQEAELSPDDLGNPNRKLVTAVVRALRSTSTIDAFNSISPNRQADVLVRMLQSPLISMERVQELADLTLISPKFKAQTGGDPANLRLAIQRIDVAAQSGQVTQRGLEVLAGVRGNFESRIPGAAIQDMLRNITDQTRSEAIKTMMEAR